MSLNEDIADELIQGVAEEISPSLEAWRIFKKNRLAMGGLIVFAVFFVTAVLGLLLTIGENPVLDPSKVRLSEKLLSPLSSVNMEMVPEEDRPVFGIYFLGTDDLGRDVFARMMQGAWVSLTVGVVAVGISVFIGVVLGGVSGYYGMVKIKLIYIVFSIAVFASLLMLISGEAKLVLYVSLASLLWIFVSFLCANSKSTAAVSRILFFETISIDTIIMRFVDIMLCFPAFFIILTVVAILPPSIYNIMIVIGLTSWMGTTRFVRAEFLSLREQDFVSAARVIGLKDTSIIFRHMMPNAVAPVIISSIIGIAGAIYTEAALSFLGFGVPPPHATWGNIFSDGKMFIFDAPWLTYIPGLTILLVVLAFNLFGEGLRDALNPKLRKR